MTIHWGAEPYKRGPIIVRETSGFKATAIGAHGGAHSIYAALGQATGILDRNHRPDLRYTTSDLVSIPANSSWADAEKIVMFDPYGHMVSEIFAEERNHGADIRPTISMTPSYISMPEVMWGIEKDVLQPDNNILLKNSGLAKVTKLAIEAAWYLPGIAARLGISEKHLRENLVTGTNGMYPELISRPDINVFLPPIGGTSIYLFGDPQKLSRPDTKITARVHDECNGSDTFGATICTCRPYLAHGVSACIQTAMEGGIGAIIFNRKEGRGLGEVIKLLVYNARANQPGGDIPENYFARTKAVAGIEDLRFQSLAMDPLHWLGMRKIDQLISMSQDKYEAITQAGIEVVKRVPLPEYLVPEHARVEFSAKKAAGYYHEDQCASLA